MTDIMGSVPAIPNLPAYTPAQVTQESPIQNLLNQFDAQREQLQKETVEALQKATVPIAQTQKPTPNLGSVSNNQMAPLNHSPVVGAGNARAQGIGNVAIAALNILGQFENKRTEQKQRVLAQDIEKYYGAIDGEQQAKQVLAQDPNNAEAKATLAKNAQIQNDILSDDKRRKQIAKALNLNFTDPSKNTAMEHKAGEQAAKSYAEQAKAQLPTQNVPNQEAIAKAQALQAQLKEFDATQRPIVVEMLRANAQQADTQARIKESAAEAILRHNDMLTKLDTEAANEMKKLNTEHAFRLKEQAQRFAQQQKLMSQLNSPAADKQQMMTDATNLADKWSGDIAKITEQYDKWSIIAQSGSKTERAYATQQMNQTKQELAEAKTRYQVFAGVVDQLMPPEEKSPEQKGEQDGGSNNTGDSFFDNYVNPLINESEDFLHIKKPDPYAGRETN